MSADDRGSLRSTLAHALVPSVAAAGVVAVMLVVFALLDHSADFRGHATGHWIESLLPLSVGLLIVKLPPMATLSRRQMRTAFGCAILLLAAGDLIEGLGAFGFGLGYEPHLHAIGSLMTLLSMPLVVLTLVALLATLALSRPRD